MIRKSNTNSSLCIWLELIGLLALNAQSHIRSYPEFSYWGTLLVIAYQFAANLAILPLKSDDVKWIMNDFH